MITQARSHELDRGLGSWHVEWYALPLVFQTASAVLEALERGLAGLVVATEAMASRVPGPASGDVEDAEARQIDRILALFDEVVGRE